jgi:ribosomal protein S6
LATQERDPRAYELMTVFIPELSEEDNQAEIEKIEALITGGGGTMKETLIASPWGRRRLAYTIRFNGVDYRDGFYTVFHFDMRPSALTDVEREMKLDTNLMRYLLVHDDPKVGEKFRPDEEGEGAEGASEGEAGVAEGGQAAAAGATSAATEATGETAPAAEAPATEASEQAETPEAPATETAAEAAPADEPAADEATPDEPATEEAPAAETTTDTAEAATNDAPADDTTDKE